MNNLRDLLDDSSVTVSFPEPTSVVGLEDSVVTKWLVSKFSCRNLYKSTEQTLHICAACIKLVYTLRWKDHPKCFQRQERNKLELLLQNEDNWKQKFAAAMHLFRLFHSPFYTKMHEGTSWMSCNRMRRFFCRRWIEQRRNVSSVAADFCWTISSNYCQ
jgi:hypothetical protein